MAALAAIGLSLLAGAADGQPRSTGASFNPVRRLTTWYGDRSLIDVEVVAVLASPAGERGSPPTRRLRFRLERAYVAGLSRGREPGNDLLSLGLDIPTGLPNASFVARLRAEGTPVAPLLSHREQMARLLTLDFSSGDRAESLADAERLLAVCRGAEIAPGLYDFDYARAPACGPFPGDERLARFVALHEERLLDLRCSPPQPGRPVLGCSLRLPFDGFAVRVAFHGSHLLRWSDRVDQAMRFLRAKQVRGLPT